MKHSVILKVFLLSIHTSFTIDLAQSDTAVINCPDIAYLGSSAQITCSMSADFDSIVYKCPCGDVTPHCQAVSGCTPVKGYSARIVNQTQTELTIISVQPRHAGNWSCSDVGNAGTSFCHLVVANIPLVNITSDVDADSVNLGDRISLTVDIGDYHCSDAYSLTLQIGSATYTCESGRNATIDNLTQTVPIIVTQAHFGNIELVIVCGNHQWNITPESVNELQPNKTNGQTTIDTGAITVTTDVPMLIIVAVGASSTVGISIIITIVCCCYRCRKQALRSGNVGSATAKAMPLEQEEAGLRINPVYVASHAKVMERPLDSAAPADPSTCLGGGDYPETRGEYVGLDRNAAQLSNIYEHLSSYEQIGNL